MRSVLSWSPVRSRMARRQLISHVVTGLSLLVLIALTIAIAIAVAYRALVRRRDRDARDAVSAPPAIATALPPQGANIDAPAEMPFDETSADLGAEKARIILALEAENAALRRRQACLEGDLARVVELDADRGQLWRELADARTETARYRELLIDLENNAPPPLLDHPGAPDDLKLIVGVGPVLERMLQQLGISTYRQIARWSERDIDEFDARLAEFPGRIRRDGWVTQARALHQSKYGETLPARG
jgi:predicted flap endonuclease-1-like 5' DNA nuclease